MVIISIIITKKANFTRLKIIEHIMQLYLLYFTLLTTFIMEL